MDEQRSRLLLCSKTFQDDDRRVRPRLPLIPTLVGTLALVNVASAVMAMLG